MQAPVVTWVLEISWPCWSGARSRVKGLEISSVLCWLAPSKRYLKPRFVSFSERKRRPLTKWYCINTSFEGKSCFIDCWWSSCRDSRKLARIWCDQPVESLYTFNWPTVCLVTLFPQSKLWLRGCVMFDSGLWLPVNNRKMLHENCGWRCNPGIRIPSCFTDSYPFVSIMFFFYHIIYSLGMTRRNLALSTFVVSGAPWMDSGWWSHIDPKKGAFGHGNLLGCIAELNTIPQNRRITKSKKNN